MSNSITMKRETKYNLVLAGWFLAIFLAIAGVSTWYSTNPTIIGLIVAIVLMLGFLFSLKAASAFLFDSDNDFKLRTASLLILVGLVAVDVFSGSHSLQTGTMKRVVGETQNSAAYTAALNSVNSIQQQLNDCPPNYFKNCKLPLSKQLQAAQEQLQTAASSGVGSAEAKFWIAMTNAVNSMTENKVEMEDVVFYTYVFIMLLASIISIYAFGILGTGKEKTGENNTATPKTAITPTSTEQKQPKTAKNSQKQPQEHKQGFGFIKQPATAKTDDDYTLRPRNELSHSYIAPPISPDSAKIDLLEKPKQRGIGFHVNFDNIRKSENTNTTARKQPATAPKTVRVQSATPKTAKQPTTETANAIDIDLVAEHKKQIGEFRQQRNKELDEHKEAVYQAFKKAISNELQPNARPLKKFLSEHLSDMSIKDLQKIGDQFLERAEREGVIRLNPAYEKGNRKPKYLKA